MSIRAFFKAHRHLRRASIGLGVAVVLYTVLGFLVIPAVARSVGQRKLSELLHRPVTIEQIRLNPYALSATIRGVRIADPSGAPDLFALKEVYVDLQLASVWKGGVVVRQVRVVEPAIHVVRTAEDRYSFSDILDAFAAAPATPAPPPAPDAKPARFSVSNIELVNGHVTLDDRWKATRHEIAGINLGVPFLSNFPYLVETFVQPAFAAVINGTKLAVDGRTKPFADSLESSIDLNLTKVDLPYYWAYVPVKLRLKLLSAVLDTKLKVTFIQYRDRPPRVDVAGDIALSALKVEDDAGRPLLELPLLDIDIASSDLLSNRLSVRRVLLKSLAAHVRRDRQGELQFSSLVVADAAAKLAGAKAAAKSDAQSAPANKSRKDDAKSAPWLVEVGELVLDSARIAFADASNPRPFATSLDPLTITVRDFSTAHGKLAKLSLAATTDASERLSVEGKLGVEPLTFDGTVALQRLSLPRFAPYYAGQILFDVRQGTLDLSVPARVSMKGKALDLVITGLRTELRDLQLRRRGDRDDFFRLPVLAVSETNFDLGRGDLVLGEIATSDARLRLEHPGQGQPWSLETLFPPPAAGPRAGEAVTRPPAPEASRKDDAFTVTVGKLDLKGWSARIEDRAPRVPAITTLDRLALRVEGLGTARGKQGRVNLQARLNGSGTLNVAGTLGLAPLQANAQVQLKTIAVVPVQPYFQDSVALLLTGGHVGLDGRVVLTSAAKGPVVTYKGEVSAGDFVAVTRDGTDELARLGKLRVSGIDLTSEPFKLSVDEVALGDFGAHVVITPQQTINLAAIVPPADKPAAKSGTSKPAAAAPAPAEPAVGTAPAVRVAAVVLSNGTIDLEDRSTRPAFATSLSHFGGRIAGLSFAEGERATVDLSGRLGEGPLEISGRINPLAKHPFVDIAFKLADVDLSAMTPYTGKYAGYAVEKGQLYLDLKYLVDARKLDAQNNVRISQFNFGQAVDSKDATKLPVRLAVSLLKDRHGVIQLDVPVSGSLDDPKFSVWGVVLTVVKNLLIKAATSPFALIGSLFGGGEELAFVEFEPGQADIPTTSRSKLDMLAKALHERPGLRLEIEGHAAPKQDLEALRSLELRRKVTAEKIKEVVAAGGDAKSGATVSDAEYPKYLKLAYRADEKVAKPKNALGMLKEVPPAEMERLLFSTIVVGQDDLRLLARQRAQVAREQILRAKPIATERIFVVEPKALAPEPKAKVRDSRVDFRLQ